VNMLSVCIYTLLCGAGPGGRKVLMFVPYRDASIRVTQHILSRGRSESRFEVVE
jgi:hypothetical protein